MRENTWTVERSTSAIWYWKGNKAQETVVLLVIKGRIPKTEQRPRPPTPLLTFRFRFLETADNGERIENYTSFETRPDFGSLHLYKRGSDRLLTPRSRPKLDLYRLGSGYYSGTQDLSPLTIPTFKEGMKLDFRGRTVNVDYHKI